VRTDDIPGSRLGPLKAPAAQPSGKSLHAARVLLQDFYRRGPRFCGSGRMRDAIGALGGTPRQINPLLPPTW